MNSIALENKQGAEHCHLRINDMEMKAEKRRGVLIRQVYTNAEIIKQSELQIENLENKMRSAN